MATNGLNGNAMLLQIADTAGGDNYVTIGAQRATSFTLNKAAVDITNKDSQGFNESMAGGGVKSCAVSASGVFVDDAAFNYIRDAGYAAGTATGTITFTEQPSALETIVLNGVTWTFVDSGANGNEVNIGATLFDTVEELATQLNASVDANISVATYEEVTDGSNEILTITYDTAGIAGNAYTLSAGTTTATVSSATLVGGTTSGTNWPFRLVTNEFTVSGKFNVDSYALSGDVNGEQTYEISLSSSEAVTIT